jgi:hypothetical protein
MIAARASADVTTLNDSAEIDGRAGSGKPRGIGLLSLTRMTSLQPMSQTNAEGMRSATNVPSARKGVRGSRIARASVTTPTNVA